MAGSFGLLALAMRNLPRGTAYMVWTGTGTASAVAVGVWLLGETLTMQRGVPALLIIAGLITMNLP